MSSFKQVGIKNFCVNKDPSKDAADDIPSDVDPTPAAVLPAAGPLAASDAAPPPAAAADSDTDSDSDAEGAVLTKKKGAKLDNTKLGGHNQAWMKGDDPAAICHIVKVSEAVAAQGGKPNFPKITGFALLNGADGVPKETPIFYSSHPRGFPFIKLCDVNTGQEVGSIDLQKTVASFEEKKRLLSVNRKQLAKANTWWSAKLARDARVAAGVPPVDLTYVPITKDGHGHLLKTTVDVEKTTLLALEKKDKAVDVFVSTDDADSPVKAKLVLKDEARHIFDVVNTQTGQVLHEDVDISQEVGKETILAAKAVQMAATKAYKVKHGGETKPASTSKTKTKSGAAAGPSTAKRARTAAAAVVAPPPPPPAPAPSPAPRASNDELKQVAKVWDLAYEVDVAARKLADEDIPAALDGVALDGGAALDASLKRALDSLDAAKIDVLKNPVEGAGKMAMEAGKVAEAAATFVEAVQEVCSMDGGADLDAALDVVQKKVRAMQGKE